MTNNEFWSILTEAEAKRLMSRGEPVLCAICDQLIQIGATFVRKRSTGRRFKTRSRYYEESCWKKLLH
jgi:hypothetical protein